jgi:hypothetical protein
MGKKKLIMYQVNYVDPVTGNAGFQLIQAYNEKSARCSFYKHYIIDLEITNVYDCGPSSQYTLSGVIDSKGTLACY